MRAFPLLVTALVIILGMAVTALASGWSTAPMNLNTNAKPVVTYSISTGTYRGNITFVNYTALMLQSIKYNIEHRIPLNQTQLSYLAFLQVLASQPSTKPSIVNVTIVSTGTQPLGPYVSYEVFLINATLSSPAPTVLIYNETTYWGSGVLGPLYLVALPGTKFAYAYIVFQESASVCLVTYTVYEWVYAFYQPVSLWGMTGVTWWSACSNTVMYLPLSLTININGVNYTLTFEPYQGTSMTYPPYPSTLNLNVTAYTGSVGVYDVPFTTPLALCSTWGLMLGTACSGGGFFTTPPNYTVVMPTYLSEVIYDTMPAILVYPTRPGLYVFENVYSMPPGGTTPMSNLLLVYANVTGPTVLPRELFSVSLPYGTCTWNMRISPSPLQLSGVANYGYLAQISGSVSKYVNGWVWVDFYGWVAGYNTSEPGFVSAILELCDNRGFWALTPVTLNITLTDEYGYPVGYGLVTFEPNYYAWGTIIAIVAVVGATSYVLITRLRNRHGRGEVVIRL
jgi:hypothetical protein